MGGSGKDCDWDWERWLPTPPLANFQLSPSHRTCSFSLSQFQLPPTPSLPSILPPFKDRCPPFLPPPNSPSLPFHQYSLPLHPRYPVVTLCYSLSHSSNYVLLSKHVNNIDILLDPEDPIIYPGLFIPKDSQDCFVLLSGLFLCRQYQLPRTGQQSCYCLIFQILRQHT